ncbi:MAG: outer membrane beta-barrel protein [Pleurocapsa sp. MO_226.B13]|nr:outer membrane beta-barrel protein [Pleurocapsa sp. MO_226.B13]
MFKAISKSNLWIIARNTTLAAAVVLGLSQGAKADDTKTYETLQVSCNPFASNKIDAQCSSNLDIKPEAEQIAQRRGRRRKSRVQGYYAGFGLGVGFPSGEIDFGDIEEIEFDDPEYDTAFIGNIFGGIKFTKNLAADLEFFLALGGVDSDSLDDAFNQLVASVGAEGGLETDGDFSAFALYINPRFELPLSSNGKFNVYVSPGIGISQTNVNFEAQSDIVDFVDDEGNDLNIDTDEDASNTGFTFQIKGGASVAFSDTLGAFAQVRYTSLPTDDDFDSINIFGTDAGLKFSF